MPTIRLPHIAEGSIDIRGARVPVVNHLVAVPADAVGVVLRSQPDAELIASFDNVAADGIAADDKEQ